MLTSFFATDLHGKIDRYEKLFSAILRERPSAVFLGGDLLPHASWASASSGDFINEYLAPSLLGIREILVEAYPQVFVILGNDDPRCEENSFLMAANAGIWQYLHQHRSSLAEFPVYGLAYVPPTPFLLKDWERYDVSRYVPPGCVSPEEGFRTVHADPNHITWATIQEELRRLVDEDELDRAVFLFHTPPYGTPLDRAALDGKSFEYVPLDVNVGSIAVERFIQERQPLLTLHGHVHESARLTGKWKIQIRRTVSINGAHDGPELALVRFQMELPADATRELL